MEKIIFLSLALPVLVFILYLGVSAILTGFKAKNEKALEETRNIEKENDQLKVGDDNLSDKLLKLNKLFQSGALTKEEFEKAKKKILDN
ncbi:SHOCT domain-containing protein [Candidatus Pelagibacter sp.]|nr:SHOCT domain-containing protein [Candidatus Pelagibacter sp.]|tara:strand:+ start:888 stop:1154 length:267 start_codon:yes stop_codon:yes gene_type:complete